MGRRVPENRGEDEIRELLFQNYRIIYRVVPDRIEIITVLHGSRDLTRIDPKPWEIV